MNPKSPCTPSVREDALSIRRQEFFDREFRRRVIESSPEIRELETRLKATLVAKERRIQVAEKEIVKQQERIENEKFERQSDESARVREEEEQLQEKKKREDRVRYRSALDNQVFEKGLLKFHLEEEKRREAEQLEEIARLIEAEDRRELDRLQAKQAELLAGLREMFMVRERWLKEEEAMLLAEETRRKAFTESRRLREEEEKQKVMERRRARDEIQSQLLDQLTVQRIVREEREALQLVLDLEEKREEEKRLWEEKERQLLRYRQLLRENIEEQMQLRERMKAKAKEEQMRMKEEMLRWITEQERLDQLTSEKRLQRMQVLRREMEELIERRRVRKTQEEERRTKEWEEWRKEEEKRMAIIQAERERLMELYKKRALEISSRQRIPPSVTSLNQAQRLILEESKRQQSSSASSNSGVRPL